VLTILGKGLRTVMSTSFCKGQSLAMPRRAARCSLRHILTTYRQRGGQAFRPLRVPARGSSVAERMTNASLITVRRVATDSNTASRPVAAAGEALTRSVAASAAVSAQALNSRPGRLCKILYRLSIAILLLMVPAAASFSASKLISLEENANGTEVDANLGDILQITLERSGATGYEWHLRNDFQDHFELVKDEKKELLREGFVGTPVLRRWQLKAVRLGSAKLILRLYREWEGEIEAVSMFRVTVRIH
jgi:predicted secreted protein